ncbi:replicative DNA helicase [Candidatus Nomurabacteria bacterium RIFCSPLOWO2_01_FULL_36_10b]|uniref:Replicative DNA helicase n=1 Tax=Candidatus Nomurabacteria bacterium RIFCSPLOWO2_01_FULL_36_10b TaxID=1801766 RepID=A0A1F6WNP7_9BACT|nr:MAG: replicative DNA helicase [Candidatus Nomurabacteria bacterium RIFCSPLOWO2_01_FULL_36_10b]
MRIPPQNIESEKALLGSILIRPLAIVDIVDMLNSEDFYIDKHRTIFDMMIDLYRKGEPIDTLSLSSRLKERNLLDGIGGTLYLTDLTSSVPSSANAEYYAEIISNKSALRKLIEAGHTISEFGFNEQEDVEDILDNAEKTVFAVTQSPKSHQFSSMKEILPGVWDTIERLHEHTGELRGIPTGFKGLDAKLSGLQKSDLVIIAARPSMGKTSLALDIARQSALLHGVPVALFSLEMSSQQLVDRMVSAQARVDLWKIRNSRNLNEDDFDRIRDAMAQLASAPIYVDDQAANTIMRMRATARRLKAQHGLGLIVVDYLQLMMTSRTYDSMVNQVTEISRSLKSLARELDVPVLALSQLSRAVESRGGKPRLSDLRDSGAIEQDADVVMFIHREKNDEGGGRQNNAEILIEKHRNGPTGVVPLYFDADKTTFLDIEATDFSDYVSEQE